MKNFCKKEKVEFYKLDWHEINHCTALNPAHQKICEHKRLLREDKECRWRHRVGWDCRGEFVYICTCLKAKEEVRKEEGQSAGEPKINKKVQDQTWALTKELKAVLLKHLRNKECSPHAIYYSTQFLDEEIQKGVDQAKNKSKSAPSYLETLKPEKDKS